VSDSVIDVTELTRRFGATTALDSVSLSLPRGAVYGLVGANGAGKTTLIRHILGLLRAEHGSVRVFGLDPVADPVGVLSRIGYLSEENDLPAWMRVDELIRYTSAFYPKWDDDYAEELRRTFALDPAAKIKELSKGQKARAGLLIALAHRPELLVLDEPSSGLDPIVRRDILGAVIRTIADEGRTVLFSSHLLGEVEQVADHVTMISHGTIVLSAPLEAIRASHAWATASRRSTRSSSPMSVDPRSKVRDVRIPRSLHSLGMTSGMSSVVRALKGRLGASVASLRTPHFGRAAPSGDGTTSWPEE
jgi:ABC-2 type transport system ATP-binding protein